MAGMTAAIIGAAAIGTAGSVAAGAMGSKAAGKAADAQAQAAQASAQVQRDQYSQARIDAYPWAVIGAQALYKYADELGIPRPKDPILPDLHRGPFAPEDEQVQQTPDALGALFGGTGQPYYASIGDRRGEFLSYRQPEQPRDQAKQPNPHDPNAIPPVDDIEFTESLKFRETPGYQFQIKEGERGILNNLSALGMKNSGAALKALTRFRSGLANQEYNNYLNRLASTAGMGQTQTNQTNALGANAAGNIGRAYQDAGAARASGYIGQANAWGNAFGNMSNIWGKALGALPKT